MQLMDDDNRIQISEIFTSIEGEGILFGTKTMFVRMAGCHLRCRWCDTLYALQMDSGNNYSIDDAKRLITECLQPNTYKVNFTGGEPLVQHEAVIELAKFVKKDKGLRTYLESACFDSGRFAKVLPYIDICKIEFKMSDSGVIDAKHYGNLLDNEIECLKTAVKNHKITYIKVVITNSTDLNEFKDLVEKNIFTYIEAVDLAGFIIQPSYGMDEPTVDKLFRFYDIVYPLYQDVRVIPQLHKTIGVK
jgi:7-carboxy-7-deazaguanine synthase